MRRPSIGILAAFCVIAAGCGAEEVPPEPAESPDAAGQVEEPAPAEEPPPPPPGPRIGRFKVTYYWLATERPGARRNATLYDRRCAPIARVSRSFVRRLTLEGTGRLADGRIVNVAHKCRCEQVKRCFMVLGKRRWGLGVGGRPLVPFRSVAVDSSVVRISRTLYIPALDGAMMPGRPPFGGFVHDGCVIADDRGGGVRGRHLDIFLGRLRHYRSLFEGRPPRRARVHRGRARCETLAASLELLRKRPSDS